MNLQRTLKKPVDCVGVGVHSGAPASLTLKPAPVGSGIVFVRRDAPAGNARIPARFDAVSDMTLGTTLTNEAGVSVQTVEHMMAALAGLGIDNVTVELTGPEIPIMDGSAAPFVFLIECAGIAVQRAPRKALRILKTVRVADGGRVAELRPSAEPRIDIMIDFASAAIAQQHFGIALTQEAFREEIARARTFGFRHEVEALRAMGLAQGGSLENSIVVDGDHVMNEGGLRYADEFARHKLLDAIGDLALAGMPIIGAFRGERTGHRMNNMLLRALFARPEAFETILLTEPPVRADGPLEAVQTA
ncbi:MAG: UDP-3-O-acyl-N-acetylglucosamine deacetylase [Alphaproteobacteria bacterium]|nr:UDP-3-O-acyl-N-acetylglucosamine deacetylase [Alphaproteobacteria bacterium]